MKSMAQLEYHYGLKVRIYPSDHQKQIIRLTAMPVVSSIMRWLRSVKNPWQLNRSQTVN